MDFATDNSIIYGDFRKEPVNFDLGPKQRALYEAVRHQNEFLLNEYHAVHKIMWTTAEHMENTSVLADKDAKDPQSPTNKGDKNACRIVGTTSVRRLAGNLHIVAGLALNYFGQHAHAAMVVTQQSDFNFSHRINHLSFGEITPGVLYPFDGEERIVQDSKLRFWLPFLS